MLCLLRGRRGLLAGREERVVRLQRVQVEQPGPVLGRGEALVRRLEALLPQAVGRCRSFLDARRQPLARRVRQRLQPFADGVLGGLVTLLLRRVDGVGFPGVHRGETACLGCAATNSSTDECSVVLRRPSSVKRLLCPKLAAPRRVLLSSQLSILALQCAFVTYITPSCTTPLVLLNSRGRSSGELARLALQRCCQQRSRDAAVRKNHAGRPGQVGR